jgi:hypothetical protein
MKTIKISVRFLSVITAIICLSSCRDVLNTTNNNDNSFLVLVDSIDAPDTVRYAAPFDINFFGTVGFNTCERFITFNVTKQDNDINIEAWGTSDFKPGQCSDSLVTMEGQKLNLTIPSPGTYRIVIEEPVDYILVKQIIVN